MPTKDVQADANPATAPSPVLAATVAAAALIAQHVIGKATRDALFLSHFSADRLPFAMTASTVLSSGIVVLFARLIARLGPALVGARAFLLHSGAMAGEWLLAQRYEAAAAVAVYLHTSAFGATILSAFWSAVSEGFDPHTAKRAIGRIGAGAAFGGVLGGGLAWGGSRVAAVPTMLLAGAALSLVGVWGVRRLASSPRAAQPRPPGDERAPASGLAALGDTPYLRLLAGVVATGALLQALLDFALGAQAKAAYGGGARLLSFFALFQTAIGVLSFLLQTTANRPALDRLGIGGTIALLPAGVAGLGLFAMGVPSLMTAALQRGCEGVLRASLFRSAYEVLFTPVPQSLKRPTKTFIDVSFDRLGGLLGSGLTIALIALWPLAAIRTVTMATVVVGALELAVAYRLHRGYVTTLAERLRAGTVELDSKSVVDATTRKTLSRTLSNLDRHTLLAKIEEARLKAATEANRLHPPTGEPTGSAQIPDDSLSDEVLRVVIDLRSRDASTVRGALRLDAARSPLLVGLVLELLARDDVAREARVALAPVVPQVVGAILDVVLDEERASRLRRRAARLLRGAPSQRTAEGLVLGLGAKALDVRYTCGQVLVDIHEQNRELRFDAATLFDRAKRELQAPSDDPRTLEHAFNVLSLTAPREAIQLAYGALQSTDSFLRGVALEYLDVVLPADVRSAMTQRLSRPPPAEVPRPRDRSLDLLLKSKDAIRLRLDELRRARDPDADPS
jgi:AAA family ATP:ADP antiporter